MDSYPYLKYESTRSLLPIYAVIGMCCYAISTRESIAMGRCVNLKTAPRASPAQHNPPIDALEGKRRSPSDKASWCAISRHLLVGVPAMLTIRSIDLCCWEFMTCPG